MSLDTPYNITGQTSDAYMKVPPHVSDAYMKVPSAACAPNLCINVSSSKKD